MNQPFDPNPFPLISPPAVGNRLNGEGGLQTLPPSAGAASEERQHFKWNASGSQGNSHTFFIGQLALRHRARTLQNGCTFNGRLPGTAGWVQRPEVNAG
ncbi:unnamed protein product [Gadus morhua 'NCC']